MRSPWQPWYDALVWLLYNLLGLVIPVGIGALIIGAISGVSLGDFTDGGQFAIYTAAMLAATVYVISKPHTLRIPFTEWFLWVAIAGICTATAFFVMATLFSNGQDVDRHLFRWPSVGLCVLAIVVAFMAVGLDNVRTSTDLSAVRNQDIKKLNRAFDGPNRRQEEEQE